MTITESLYEDLLETLDILSNQSLMKEIKKAEEELRKGKGIPWKKAKQKLGYNREKKRPS